MDDDGQFLLIESADLLPDWLDPSTADNRVFLYQGLLHIIPLPKSSDEQAIFPTGRQLSLIKAIGTIRSYSDKTKASVEVHEAALARCSEFPKYVLEGDYFHRAKCVVPRDIAKVLKMNPALIAPAIEAFYLRDPLKTKVYWTSSKASAQLLTFSLMKLGMPNYEAISTVEQCRNHH
jgi:hypothetical protein